MLLFVCSCFMDFVVVFVEAWRSLLFHDAVVCLFLFKDFVVVFVEAWWSLLFRDAVVCLLNRSKDGRKCFI